MLVGHAAADMVRVMCPHGLNLPSTRDHTHAPAGVEVAEELGDPLKQVVAVRNHT